MRRRALYLAVACVLVAVAVGGLMVRGLNYGVEFTGGRLVEYSTSTPMTADAARELVSGAGFPNAVVQSSGDDISVRAGQISTAEATKIETRARRAGEARSPRNATS